MLHISKKQARLLLLHKQFLLPPQSLSKENGIDQVFQSLRLIQYDPLNPCGRNVDLVLQSRISLYHPNDYYEWLYTEKKGIEAYDKELCILPIEDFSLTHNRQYRVTQHEDKQVFLKRYQTEIEDLLQFINTHGPIASSDVDRSLRVMSGWGTEATFGRVALENLWKMGRVVVVKREKGKKYYDLPHKVHASLVSESFQQVVTREHILKRLGSVGMLPVSGSGGGWQGLGSTREVAQIISHLITQKELREVTVADSSKTYVIHKNDESLCEVSNESTLKKVVFLAALDNLMWDREMVHDLFGFYYRWEVYTPAAKRTYGYYVLPVLYGEQFIARVEPVLRKDNVLEVKGWWKEKKVGWSKEMQKACEIALEEFKDYVGAKEIVGIRL